MKKINTLSVNILIENRRTNCSQSLILKIIPDSRRSSIKITRNTINAEKIKVTGNKLADKMYHRHTGYIGNLKSINLEKQLARHPERVIQSAVKGMLPRNPLGRAMFRKLHVYAGPEHPHTAQQPKELDL